MFHVSERMWLFYGLFFATLIFLSLGSSGLGVGGSFQAWNLFLDVIRTDVTLEIVFIVIAFILSLLPLLATLGVALLGAYVFSKIFGSGGTAATMEDMLGGIGGKNLPVFLVFVMFILLLL